MTKLTDYDYFEIMDMILNDWEEEIQDPTSIFYFKLTTRIVENKLKSIYLENKRIEKPIPKCNELDKKILMSIKYVVQGKYKLYFYSQENTANKFDITQPGIHKVFKKLKQLVNINTIIMPNRIIKPYNPCPKIKNNNPYSTNRRQISIIVLSKTYQKLNEKYTIDTLGHITYKEKIKAKIKGPKKILIQK